MQWRPSYVILATHANLQFKPTLQHQLPDRRHIGSLPPGVDSGHSIEDRGGCPGFPGIGPSPGHLTGHRVAPSQLRRPLRLTTLALRPRDSSCKAETSRGNLRETYRGEMRVTVATAIRVNGATGSGIAADPSDWL